PNREEETEGPSDQQNSGTPTREGVLKCPRHKPPQGRGWRGVIYPRVTETAMTSITNGSVTNRSGTNKEGAECPAARGGGRPPHRCGGKPRAMPPAHSMLCSICRIL